MAEQQNTPVTRPEEPKAPVPQKEHETEPAQEWGERLDTGKTIARGGKTTGAVPGAEPKPE